MAMMDDKGISELERQTNTRIKRLKRLIVDCTLADSYDANSIIGLSIELIKQHASLNIIEVAKKETELYLTEIYEEILELYNDVNTIKGLKLRTVYIGKLETLELILNRVS